MRIGIFGGDVAGSWSLDEAIASARQAEADGFDSYWLPNIFGLDALTALAVLGRETDRIELGSDVVPVHPRHPLAMAQQALTAQVASGGRLTLGLGVSHKLVVEGMFGGSYDRPARYMREFLSVLNPLLDGQPTRFDGEVLKAMGAIRIPGATAPRVMIAAMGPHMLDLAGAMTDGTLLAWTGEKTIAGYVAPRLRAAADKAGRPAPRIGTALPICVTDDESAARERIAEGFKMYDGLPSYRGMLDREGVARVADVAVVGSEDAVRERLASLESAGVTDFQAVEYPNDDDERERTRAVLESALG
ncbi:MAG: TIGR03564 family F420-dependent LLM class oxidoreductase [Deltaproteobacteria bacterium]|nr:TIGR03564 family F420-dependent LLM class oxidoreductase [Deltaproteobacteria bacterium]MBW2414015.1 TIGR03564 family F420-dependent LLM class oxidoreductase [Deltaproteobacteria bacterium]